MARLSRGLALLVFFMMSWAAPVSAGCLEDMLHIAGLHSNSRFLNNADAPRTKEMLKHAAYHNELAELPLSKFSDAERSRKIDQMIDHYAQYDTNIDGDAFKAWLKENPGMVDEGETLGAYANKQFKEFEKKHPSVKPGEVAEHVTDDMRKIAKECKGSLDCAKTKITAWGEKKLSKSCVWRNEEARRDLINMMLLTNSSYFVSYLTDDKADKEFPIDLMVNNLLWQPYLAEKGCLGALGNNQIGQKINFGQVSAFANYGSRYKTFLYASPKYNFTLVTISTIKDAYQGKEIDWATQALKIGALTFYDGVYANNRILLVQNPFFLKHFPNLKERQQRFYAKDISNPLLKKAFGKKLDPSLQTAFSNVSYYPLDWGVRIGIGVGNTRIYQWYMDAINENFGNKEAPADPLVDENTPEGATKVIPVLPDGKDTTRGFSR